MRRARVFKRADVAGAPLIADGLVRVFDPDIGQTGKTLAVVSASRDANSGVTTEQWFVFASAYTSLNIGGWATINTGVWQNHLPVSGNDRAADAKDLSLERLSDRKPSPTSFFSAMKQELVTNNMDTARSTTYVIARYAASNWIDSDPTQSETLNSYPVYLERMYAFGTIDARKRAHFCANHTVTQVTQTSWFRSRLMRAIWRADLVKLPPEVTIRKDGITDEPANMTPSDWWQDRKSVLDPQSSSSQLMWARFNSFEYDFSVWSGLSAPP